MSHSFNKIWIHAVWATKDRAPLIHPSIEQNVLKFIEQQLQQQGCKIEVINGMSDHVHCLFLLNRQKSIAEVIKQIKGSSSHFINQNNFIPLKFAWQTGYGAFSVSESGVKRVFEYIKNQKQHHRNKSSRQEFDDFLRLHGCNGEE